MCASFVLDGGAEFGGAERCEGVWHGGEEGVIFLNISTSLRNQKVKYTRPLSYLLYSAVVKLVSYLLYHNRILRWAGHVARIPISRAPRQLLTSWVAHSRPVGCPQMTWGRTLENALTSEGISKEIKERIATTKDKPKRRQQTHSKQTTPDG